MPGSQFRQGLVDGQDVWIWSSRGELFNWNDLLLPFSATLLPALATSTFNQNAAHCFGSRCKEMAATVPVLDLVGINQPKVCLVHKRRWLERLSRPLSCKLD